MLLRVASDPAGRGGRGVNSEAAAAGPHDHLVTFSVTTGSLWLRVLLVAGALTVAAFGQLRPFFAEQSRATGFSVAAVAAGAGLVQLLLADGLDVPPQAAVPLLAGLVLPIVAIRSRDSGLAVHARRIAPWVLVSAAAGAGTEFARAWLGFGAQDTALHTGLVVALVGLSWLTLCQPRTRYARASVGAVGWLLGTAVVAVTAQVALLALAVGR